MAELQVNRGRKVSTDGAKLVGSGFFSDVYQVSDDTVLKVLKTDDVPGAEREIRLCKWAFKKGVSTAISFDVVDVDGRPGMVYEFLGARNLRDEVRDHGDRFPQIMDGYTELIRSINAVTVDDYDLPRTSDVFLQKLDAIRALLTPEEAERMASLIRGTADCRQLIHGDCHVKNIMVGSEEYYIIDLDSLSCGSPVYELSGLYSCYKAFGEYADGDYDDFMGLPRKTVSEIYDALFDRYFAGLTAAERAENDVRIKLAAYMHMMFWYSSFRPEKRFELERFRDSFRTYLPQVQALDLIL